MSALTESVGLLVGLSVGLAVVGWPVGEAVVGVAVVGLEVGVVVGKGVVAVDDNNLHANH